MKRTITTAACVGALAAASFAQSPASKPQTYKGLEIAVTGVERASSSMLNDCPPGANTVKGMTRPGEEFAIVTIAFKVLPGYQPAPLKRPALNDKEGKTYNTAVSFVDVGKIPEFSCAFPYRIPAGTSLKSVQLDTLTFDVSSLDAKKP